MGTLLWLMKLTLFGMGNDMNLKTLLSKMSAQKAYIILNDDIVASGYPFFLIQNHQELMGKMVDEIEMEIEVGGNPIMQIVLLEE